MDRLRDQPARALVWGDPAFPANYRGDVPIVYGHWNNAELDADGWPVPATRTARRSASIQSRTAS